MRVTFSLARLAKRAGRRKVKPLRPIEPTQALERELLALVRSVVAVWRGRADLLETYRVALARSKAAVVSLDGSTAIRDDETALGALRAVLDLIFDEAETLQLTIKPRIERWVDRFEAWFRRRFGETTHAAVGVDVDPLLNADDVRVEMRGAVEQIASLIKDINADARKRIEMIVWAGVNRQAPAHEVAKEIGEATGIVGRRAELIASDQTAKLTAVLNAARQKQAGIDKYVWETRLDDRVRPSHWAKSGKVFSWDKPPKDTGHPGEDVGCRCVARPYIDLAAELRE